MKKHFKNENRITIPNVLKLYQNFIWGDYPHYNYRREEAMRIIRMCEESDEYINWSKQYDEIQEKIKETKAELAEIEANKLEILLKNSEEEYWQVWKQLDNKKYQLENQLDNHKAKAPKSKNQLLKKLYDAMEEGKRQADNEFAERSRQENSKCSCKSYERCEC